MERTPGAPDRTAPSGVELPLDSDIFFRGLLRHLAGTLQDVIGLQEAEGFVSVVGQRMGEEIDALYRRALRLPVLDRDTVADALVDLKARIGGDFYVVECTEERIVLGNRACPFGEMVRDRPALCMMTSNVFGALAAENLGYARVAITRAIARGDDGCRVEVSLTQPEPGETPPGREYFRSGPPPG